MELLPPAKRGGDRSKWPASHLIDLPKEMMGLREHGVRLQNLVIDAEYRFVELLPPAKRGRPWEVMLPAGNINLPRDAGLGWVSAAAGLAPFGTP